ncbi:MAG: mechanosensitive ion channel family protein, partial [Microcystis panniformis]
MKFVPVVDINQRDLMQNTASKARGWIKKNGHTLLIFVVVLLLTLTSPLLGIAQNPTQPENKIDGFPVMLDGKPLFFIRRGVSSFSAEERANTITRRIERIAQNDSIPVENLRIEQLPDDNSLYLSVDQEVILTVTEQDAKAYRSTPEVLAQQALQKIQFAITQYRQDRKPEQLLTNIIYTVIATFAFLIISFAVIKISGKLFPLMRRLIESLTPGIQIGNVEIISSSKISCF